MTIIPFDDLADAVSAANSGEYALQAGVFTASVQTAFTVSALMTGAVVVNGTSDLRIDSMPFGGFKGSGIGREGVQFAVEAMTSPRTPSSTWPPDPQHREEETSMSHVDPAGEEFWAGVRNAYPRREPLLNLNNER